MEAIKDIGTISYEDIKSEDKLLEIFTEDFSKGSNYDRVIEVELLYENYDLEYKGINIREYDVDMMFKYLYRSGSSRGTDITPTAKITDVPKTYSNKLVAGVKEGINYLERNKERLKSNYDQEIKLLNDIYRVLNNNEVIIKDITRIFNEVPKKERYFILTFIVEKDNEEIYVGDLEVYKDMIREIPIKKFYYSKTNDKTSKFDNSRCCLCHNDTEVFGLASPFAFYTIDKPGYISGGFNYEESWKNYPVCKECGIKLDLGKSYLDEHLLLSFYRRKFYLVPKPIHKDHLREVLTKYESRFRNDDDKSGSKMIKEEMKSEERSFKTLSKEGNNITFDLMFIEEKNAALNILMNIEDVYPSTLKRLYDSWDEIKMMNFFKDYSYLANFSYLNMLFSAKENNKYFLEMVDKLLGQGKIEYNFLISFINKKLKEAFIREEKGEFIKGDDNYFTSTIRAYTFIYYLYKINKFKDKGKEGVERMERETWDKRDFDSKRKAFNDFFNSNKAFFNTDSKKAVFMLGYMSKKLLNLQSFLENGRKPFISNLNGLNLNKKDLQRLMPKIQGKFIEYKKEFYNEELLITSEYLLDSNNLSDLSNLEIPLYFSIGMNMVKKFNLNKEEEQIGYEG